MVRTFHRRRVFSLSSPHTRGDGPLDRWTRLGENKFSPHAWGWSGVTQPLSYPTEVLPTRVGMVRSSKHRAGLDPRSPHTRGDGPPIRFPTRCPQVFSPHAWGWSVFVPSSQSCGPVLPTRVGMVRRICSQVSQGNSSPHTRGDGPPLRASMAWNYPFSPHAWGWSACLKIANAPGRVLPTRVGMVRSVTPVLVAA